MPRHLSVLPQHYFSKLRTTGWWVHSAGGFGRGERVSQQAWELRACSCRQPRERRHCAITQRQSVSQSDDDPNKHSTRDPRSAPDSKSTDSTFVARFSKSTPSLEIVSAAVSRIQSLRSCISSSGNASACLYPPAQGCESVIYVRMGM